MVTQQLQFEWCRSANPEGEAQKETEAAFQVSTASGNAEPISIVTMEEVVRKGNLLKALKRVKANKGSAGIDGMTVDDLPDFLKDQWPIIRQQLLNGQFKPQPVKKVMIPKAGGGSRMLGIPTVTDRFI